ncbi:MAG TPA: flagellar protein FlbB [Spirochaetia bacterium]|nr:flagellar protein FlbB [Spirochaetia bacterium]
MASYGGVGAAPRILVLLLLIIALVFGGLVWFDYLGLINARQTLAPLLTLVGIGAPAKLPNAQDPLLLERQRLDKLTEALSLKTQQLDKRQQDIQQQEALVKQKEASLAEQEKALVQREKSFNQTVNQYDNRSANLRAVANNLLSMPPKTAASQLEAMSDQDVIDIMREADQIAASSGQSSIVPYWLSLLPADRAATLSRKMLKQPTVTASSP